MTWVGKGLKGCDDDDDDDDDAEDGDDLFGHWPWRINSVKTVGVKAGVVEHLAVVKVCVQMVDCHLKSYNHLEMKIVDENDDADEHAADDDDKEGDEVQHLLVVKHILACSRI